MNLSHDLVVLVANGSRMMLLRNTGGPKHPDLHVLAHRADDNPPNRDLLSDAPGVSASAGYPGRDTFAKSDPHKANQQRFLAEAAETLANSLDGASGVVVIAAPDALGELRRRYAPKVRKALLAEIDRDLVKQPIEAVTRLLVAHEAVAPVNTVPASPRACLFDAPSAMRSGKPSGWADAQGESASGLMLR